MPKSYFQKDLIEVGCDEAGRGCLAGPVAAAAVILPKTFKNNLLNDSKQLKESDRLHLREVIKNEALAWAIAMISPSEIDRLNILNASILAMHLSIDQLKLRPEYIIVDGNRFHPYQDVQSKTIIKGDNKYASIAAASILAKTYRDDYMDKHHEEYPEYSWITNKGYPTVKHRKAIIEYGITPLHRLSFRLLPKE